MAAVPALLALAVMAAVALLFAVAAIGKLRHRALLPGVIANYRLLPGWAVAPAALLLAPAELLVALGLLAGLAPAALAAAALLLVFAGAMAINIGRGRRHIDCGCGHAALRQPLGWGPVLRNIGLAMALLLALPVLAAAPADAATRLLALLAGTALYLLAGLFAALRRLAQSAASHGLAPGIKG